jgi:hypothetical protein
LPTRALIASDTIHIDEGTIIAGSAALSLAVPALLSWKQARKVQQANPDQITDLLNKEDGVVLVDVRTQVSALLVYVSAKCPCEAEKPTVALLVPCRVKRMFKALRCSPCNRAAAWSLHLGHW